MSPDAIAPLSVVASLDALSTIGRYLDDVSKAAGLSRQRAYNLRLAIDEVATNIILYGYERNGLSGNLVARAAVTDDAVSVTIEDNGPEFDPRSRAMPSEEDLAKPLEDRGVGGLGIFLALKSVDEFRYERRGTTNLNTFVVHRRSQP